MMDLIKVWGGYNGELVYTNNEMTFSFLENSVEAVRTILERGYPIDKDNGESVDIITVSVNSLNDDKTISTNFLKGLHRIYTNVKII